MPLDRNRTPGRELNVRFVMLGPEPLTAFRALHPLKIQALDRSGVDRESTLGAFRIPAMPARFPG